jgi:hypothetical protein
VARQELQQEYDTQLSHQLEEIQKQNAEKHASETSQLYEDCYTKIQASFKQDLRSQLKAQRSKLEQEWSAKVDTVRN